ncbi:MAG TPA: MMPL family transporter [Planctomycetaceae bacterium]|nr:MMPL family transporter [Planctomycetaceae bacterium]
MFDRLGKIIERRWQAILVVWGLALLAALGMHRKWYDTLFHVNVPTWKTVAKDGEFSFLPNEMQSLVGEQLLAKAFPEDLLKSSVVIIVRRYKQPIRPEDEEFIEEVLKPGLEKIRDDPKLNLDRDLQIMTFSDKRAGRLLVSDDHEASLVIMPLKSEFLEWHNLPIIERVEKLLYVELPNDPENRIPPGLDLAMSGSATVGRDMLVASQESARATEFWTTVLVIGLLGAIYRAPLLAFIPLITVYVSVQIALALVILLTQVPVWNYRVFYGMEVYITVVTYGTGVDYCLFLIARYKEELDKHIPLPKALTATLSRVGAAVTASAFTVICGIGMMVFAQFGKFREAGIGISLSLFVGLCAALTLTPALLRLSGRAAFFPFGRTERIPSEAGWKMGTSLFNRLVPRNRFQVLWEYIGGLLVRKPGTILATCVLVMLPFAMLGLYRHDFLSYGLLSELPATKKSVDGAKAVQEHFPAGYAGPLTILIQNDEIDPETRAGFFSTNEGSAALQGLIGSLEARSAELGIADIRYLDAPQGFKHRPGQDATTREKLTYSIAKARGKAYYISSVPGLEGGVTRIDVVFGADPFARESIQQLNAVEGAIKTALQNDDTLQPLRKSQFHYVGPTASIRDLKTVTDHDQLKIDFLVLGVVFVILLALLHKVAISAYLIISVFFSYFVALGVTFAFYWLKDPQDFGGLDWKVPMFLFTILIAIGEDYNIFLMTRIDEEQKRHGPVEGVRIAMLRTGTIISSCGIIMAGTFLSLFAGTLVGLQQLGFALAFGVLLDTFVVRPLLVPAYLILLFQGRFGAWGRFLGAGDIDKKSDRPATRPRAHADA